MIAGDPQQQATRLLVHSILRDFHPDLVVLYAEDANALSGDAAQALPPPCDPSREGLLSTSAKTLAAARLSPRRRTRAGYLRSHSGEEFGLKILDAADYLYFLLTRMHA